MFQTVVFHREHAEDEFLAFCLSNVENVDFDELLNQVSALIRRNLKSIDSKTQEDFSHGFFWLCFITFCLYKLVLMILEHLLGDQQMRSLALLVIFQFQQ